ncbi:2Fe-2S iron-sulfur cluster-binding protein [Streptosporangium sp. NPDC006013]|uniref:(2Fe-2S)-binding protein n=1 Tax=Streptosporangium sp. NPDC006013 TaxID=3155596 RepID=UPI0033ADDB49
MDTFTVNGTTRAACTAPGTTLASVLRDQLGLTSVKLACERGECGACTVLVGGRPRLSCVTLAVLVDEEVTTAEGLAEESADLRAAFADRGAFQCGFCTPGHIVHATALLRSGLPAAPERAAPRVRRELSGNICRCTGYAAIVEAVCETARLRAATEGATEGATDGVTGGEAV